MNWIFNSLFIAIVSAIFGFGVLDGFAASVSRIVFSLSIQVLLVSTLVVMVSESEVTLIKD